LLVLFTPALADRTAVPTPIVPAELVPGVAKGALTPFVVAESVRFGVVVVLAFTLFAGAATGALLAVVPSTRVLLAAMPFTAVVSAELPFETDPLFAVEFAAPELFAGGSAVLIAVGADASGRAFSELNAPPLANFGPVVAIPPAAPSPLAFVPLPVCAPIAPLVSVVPPTTVAPVLAMPFVVIPFVATPFPLAAFVGFVLVGFVLVRF